MTCGNLQSLGEEKFRRITDELKRDTPVTLVASLIHQEWGDCQDVPEKRLAAELQRLQALISAANCANSEEQSIRNKTIRTNLLDGSTQGCLDPLVELAIIQKQRTLALLEKEQRRDSIIPELETAIRHYGKLLVDIQDMKFDLGIDVYRRSVSAAEAHAKHCEDQRAIFEAYAAIEKVFDKRAGSRHETVSTIRPGYSEECGVRQNV